jgi:hypothetical protein
MRGSSSFLHHHQALEVFALGESHGDWVIRRSAEVGGNVAIGMRIHRRAGHDFVKQIGINAARAA